MDSMKGDHGARMRGFATRESEPLSTVGTMVRSAGWSLAKVRLTLWLAGLTATILQAVAFRHIVSPDAISYLDIARGCVQGNWHSLVNGYWSPLYPFLLGLVFRVLKPSPYWESTVAHFANIGIFVFAFASFEFLIASLVREHRRSLKASEGLEALPEQAMWALGDGIFVCYTLLFNSLGEVHPDLCVAGLVFLAAALLTKIRALRNSYWTYAALGGVLGLAYLAKNVMFPLSFAVLGCCLFAAKPFRKSVPRTALAFVCFVGVGAPFLWTLSRAKGRPTFGDTGKIAYAEFVDGTARYVNWQGGPDGVGRPVHPTHQLLANPPVFEFSAPIGGTYPPWYDPSYWYEGIIPAVHLKNQLRAIRYTIQEYAGILPYMGGLLTGFIGLYLFSGTERAPGWRDLLQGWSLLIPALAALGLYSLVYVEARLVGAFLVLGWVSLFAGLRFRRSPTTTSVQQFVTLGVVGSLFVGIAWIGARSLFRTLAPQPFVNWEVAAGLHKMGIEPGDRVASIGDSLNAYWAHLAGVRIVAEVPLGGREEYWSSSPQIQSEILADFSKYGAKVAVTDEEPPRALQGDWIRIGGTNYFVHNLALKSARYQEGP